MTQKARKKTLLPIDELNRLEDSIVIKSHKDEDGKYQYDEEDIIDEMLDLFLLAIARGQISASEDLGIDLKLTVSVVEDITSGKGTPEPWREAVHKHVVNGDPPSTIQRVADTEFIRMFNAAADAAAHASGKPFKKKWFAIMDERTRDTHVTLNGTIVGQDERFYSTSGDSALYPGDFETPEENVNCRCGVIYIPA